MTHQPTRNAVSVGVFATMALVLAVLFTGALAAQPTTFVGSHENTLFGNPGGGDAEVNFNQTSATTATYDLILQGDIFGAMPPGGVVLSMDGTRAGNLWNFATPATHPVFGDVSLSVDETTGASTGMAAGISGFGSMFNMSTTGTVSSLSPGGVLSLNHQIFEDGNPTAVGFGTLNATSRGSVLDIPTLGTIAQIALAGFLALLSIGLLRRTVAG